MTKTGVFVLVVCVLPYVLPEPTESETVWLKDVTASFLSNKRILGDPDLPDDLTFHLRHGSEVLTLNLKRNHGIDPNANVYFVRKLNDGRQFLENALHLEKEDLAYYQDKENGAFMTVRCVRGPNRQCDRIINGNIRMDDNNYDLRPAEMVIQSRDTFDIPDHRGIQYVRRHQAKYQEDAESVSKKEVKQGLHDFMRFSQKHVKHARFPMTSRNVSDLNTAVRRNLEHVYYVQMSVLLDSGVSDFYSSLFSNNQSTTDSPEVVKKIREFFSHVINGASMLYKYIEDPSIAIRITLREFLIFKTIHEFRHNKSEVTEIEGRHYIDVNKYLEDLADWTGLYGAYSDNVMLFTKYDLYDGSPDKNNIIGLSYPGLVCDKLYKVSVVEAREYFVTMSTAAHELGHNLGAEHDGEGSASACNSEDLFIMSPMEPEVGYDKTKLYSRNPWMFSNCSVDAFKKTLASKNCLMYRGIFYDWKEWRHFIKKTPGEVYSNDMQCEFIHGRGSFFCGTVSPAICGFMKCADPETKQCVWKFYRAARGTRCGENRWCIDGRCVS